jgi:carboxymethylenebutenolidase
MTISTHFITLHVAGAPGMNAYVAMPDSREKFPGIMLFQEAFGVNHHIRNIADRLAKEGYVVIAPELFHRTAEPGFEAGYTEFHKIQEHFKGITNEGLEADTKAAYDWLLSQTNVKQDKIASIGFCLGGRVSIIANSILPLSASVSYYGGGMHLLTDRISELHAPQLLVWGGLDKHILPEHIEQVIQAFKNADKPYVNISFSYADHGFHCDERASYNEHAAKEAWALTLAFLKNKLNR